MKTNLLLLFAALLIMGSTFAQTSPPDGLVSPEVHSDGKVTFRIRAAKAKAPIHFLREETLW